MRHRDSLHTIFESKRHGYTCNLLYISTPPFGIRQSHDTSNDECETIDGRRTRSNEGSVWSEAILSGFGGLWGGSRKRDASRKGGHLNCFILSSSTTPVILSYFMAPISCLLCPRARYRLRSFAGFRKNPFPNPALCRRRIARIPHTSHLARFGCIAWVCAGLKGAWDFPASQGTALFCSLFSFLVQTVTNLLSNFSTSSFLIGSVSAPPLAVSVTSLVASQLDEVVPLNHCTRDRKSVV